VAALVPLSTYTGAVSCRVDRDNRGGPTLVLRAGTAPLGLSVHADEAPELLCQILRAITLLPRSCATCRHAAREACPPCDGADGSAWAPGVPREMLALLERSLSPDEPE